jgi:molybdenum cofactor biosynthesis enzyme MoaA
MVLNTSLNRRGEPIVSSPQDAVECFLAMKGADVLIVGPFMAKRRQPVLRRRPDRFFRGMPDGRRLMLRLTARCDCACAHCTVRDIAPLRDRLYADAIRALAEGRQAGCSELVIMRGEPALWSGLPKLLARARDMGYRFIQLQTSGRAPQRPGLRRLADAFEITLLSADEAKHDALAATSGAFRQALGGARAAVAAGREVIFSVPILRRNHRELSRIAVLAARVGAARVDFCVPRPVETTAGVQAEPLARLAAVSASVREALRAAAKLGLAAGTEAMPFCHLDPDQRRGSDAGENWARFRVDDLGRLEESLDPRRGAARPEAPACRTCRERRLCPRTWALYLALFGSSELCAIR